MTLPHIPEQGTSSHGRITNDVSAAVGLLHGRATPARRRTTSQAVRPEHDVDDAERFVGSVPRELLDRFPTITSDTPQPC
jgi:hypothetical protein